MSLLSLPADLPGAAAHLADARAAMAPPAGGDHGVHRAVVVGAGTMGSGIAQALIQIGCSVRLVDQDGASLARAQDRLRETWQRQCQRGRLSTDQMAAYWARLTVSTEDAADPSVNLVVEAVYEDLALKQQILGHWCAQTGPDTLLATNTSTLDIDRIAAATSRPHAVIGTHFFVPAAVTPLLEIVPGAATDPATLLRIRHLAAALGKIGVIAGICDGFIGNSMFDQYCRQAMFLLEEGALPGQIDQALERWGMVIGPFRSFDLIGNDVPWAARRRRQQEGSREPQPLIGDRLCAQGWFGRKSGRGWYRYDPTTGAASADQDVAALIAACRQERGWPHRPISDVEIIGRCVLALAVKGAELVATGIAQHASDVDVVSVTGYGFPAGRGGPLFCARSLEPATLAALLAQYRDGPSDPSFWPLASALSLTQR